MRRPDVDRRLGRRRRDLADALGQHLRLSLGDERDDHRPLGQLRQHPDRPDRQSDEQRSATGNVSYSPHGRPERELLGTDDSDGGIRDAALGRRDQHLDEVSDRDRANRALAESDRPEHGPSPYRARHVVDHVIAGSVDHRGLEDGVVDTRLPDQLLGGPLGLVVAGPAVGPRTQEAHHHDPLHAGVPCGLDHGARPLDVHALEGLLPDLAVDPRRVNDHLASGEGGSEVIDVLDVDARAAGDDDRVGRIEPRGEIPADEAGSTGDGDAHGFFLRYFAM